MGVIRYFPRRVDVLASLHDAATVAVEAAHLLGDLFAAPETASDVAPQLRELERRGDVFTHEVVIGLNRGGLPGGRQDDLRAIVSALADVIRTMAEVGQRAALYGLPTTASAGHVAGILQAQAAIVAVAVTHLADEVPHEDLRHAVMELHQLATEADRHLNQATDRAEKIGHAMLRIQALGS